MRKGAIISLTILALAAAGAVGAWALSAPSRLPDETLAALGTGNVENGRRMFFAGGCASCHADPQAKGEDRFRLIGGVTLETQFGTFVAPNISQHPTDGIGAWSLEDFANAMLKGVTPGGRHLYPAFPYASYARMAPSDVGDLHAFLKTTPAVEGAAPGNALSFPYNIRRGVGFWKLFNLSDEPVVALPADASEQVRLGQYLVEGPGHCGECHTPRDATGGSVRSAWLAGSVAAEGDGNIPNITGGEGGIGDWSQADLVSYFETGFTPDFDSVGGSMVEVQQNLAELRPEDREAIAAYLKAIPALPNGY